MPITERTRRLLWFVGLWAASVVAVGGAVVLLRWIFGLG